MYKYIFLKVFLFVFYLTAGLISKFHGPVKDDSIEILGSDGTHEIGVATNWMNPYVTRYSTTTTTTKRTTTTVFLRTKSTTKKIIQAILDYD